MDPKITPSKPARVFIVDDETMVTTSLKTMLELETGLEIHSFNNPTNALAQLLDIKPSVVISDFLMPEMDGIAFLKQVKEKLPESTLILLTGYADKESAIEAINHIGIYRYIEKPWDNEELKLTIKNGIERADLIQSLEKTIEELTEAKEQLEKYNETLESLVRERTIDLETTYQKLQSIVQNTADGILSLDETLKITSYNLTAESFLLNVKKLNTINGFIGNCVSDFIQLPHAEKNKQTLQSFFEPTQSRLLKEALIGPMLIEVSISPIPETELHKGGFVLVLRDISKRKEIERLRDDFMSALTHDLRTPLHAAIQSLEFFQDGSIGPLTDKQAEVTRVMLESQKDMLTLVNDLLDVYRYEGGQQKLILDTVNLGEIIEAIQTELKALASQKNQTIVVNLQATDSSLLWVRGDKRELRRVFMNLISNALKHTPMESQVTIKASLDNGQVTIMIKDNGQGIPPSDLPRLFQRFSQGTSKQRSSGTGLGLYLSRQIVEAHQGALWAESTEGEGSCFYVSLPALNAPKPDAPLEAQST